MTLWIVIAGTISLLIAAGALAKAMRHAAELERCQGTGCDGTGYDGEKRR